VRRVGEEGREEGDMKCRYKMKYARTRRKKKERGKETDW
jgi:hypothetical protein